MNSHLDPPLIGKQGGIYILSIVSSLIFPSASQPLNLYSSDELSNSVHELSLEALEI